MRIWTRVPLVLAIGVGTVVATAAPALAAAPVHAILPACHNQLPEVPYAALVPFVGIAAVLLIRRRHARSH